MSVSTYLRKYYWSDKLCCKASLVDSKIKQKANLCFLFTALIQNILDRKKKHINRTAV